MALTRYRVNASVGGLGRAGEYVVGDPVLWGAYVDAGYLTQVTDDGDRVVVVDLPDGVVSLDYNDEGIAPIVEDDA